MKIWEPKPPGTLRATSGLLRDCFSFLLYILVSRVVINIDQFVRFEFQVFFAKQFVTGKDRYILKLSA